MNATELTKAFQRNCQPTELGKVYKTKHQLRYISDEIYALQILEQLNKGKQGIHYVPIYFMEKKGNSIKPILTKWKSN